ncbi:MAG: nickel insertion protein, partial [Terriglobales bacterium]
MQVTVLAEAADRERMSRLLFRETSTIGVRFYAAERQTLDRSQEAVDTRYGPLRVKVSRLDGELMNFAPEYEDCRRVAAERGVPLKMVLAEASSRYLEQFGRPSILP